MEEIILKAKAQGKSEGIILDAEYRFVLYSNKWNEASIRPEQSFGGEFNEFSALPGWTLESLLSSPRTNELMIDMGQMWSVSGLERAIAEAQKIISQ